MKPKLYVETTIAGYLAARKSRDLVTAAHQHIMRQWWKHRRKAFDLYCSELVLAEAAAGDAQEAKKRLALLKGIATLEASAPALGLARALVRRKAMPPKAQDDAVHLAIAAVNGMDYLLTWNCRHLANAALKSFLERICKKAGYPCPVICTPEELLED